jgi:hypothetical protein
MQFPMVAEYPQPPRLQTECALKTGAWRPLSEAVFSVLREVEDKSVAEAVVEQCLPKAA